ncbi:secretory pathway protein Sec39-domain-containing protein, partial [Blyttiomyces helicus]
MEEHSETLGDLGFEREDSLLLYELVSVKEWSPAPVDGSDDLTSEPSGTSSRRPSAIGAPAPNAPPRSYATIPKRFMKNVASTLVRTLDGLVISPSVPPALVQLLPLVRPPWVLRVSPCGSHLAILQDDRLELRSTHGAFDLVATVLLDRDSFPSWRRLAWSFDSSLVAVSGSNGGILIVRSSGSVVCSILNKTRDAAAAGGILSSRPVNVDWKALGIGGGHGSVGFIDPLATLLLLRPNRSAAPAAGAADPLLFTHDGHPYTHELIAITYDGTLRSYLINADSLLPYSSPTNTSSSSSSFVTSLGTRRSSILGLSILRESNDRPGHIIFYHKFSFRHWHKCVSNAVADQNRGVLLVSGTGVMRGRDKAGEKSSGGFLSEWRMTADKPYYRMRGVETVDPHVHVPADEDEGNWAFLRKVFTIESVLTSLQPSRRQQYLETIHAMALSPTGEHLLTLDCGGTLKLWSPGTLEWIAVWGPEELNRKAEGDQAGFGDGLSSGDEGAGNAAAVGAEKRPVPLKTGPKATEKVISVDWWSDSSAVLTYSDGRVIIANLPGLQNLLGPLPERFRPGPSVTAVKNDRLFILESEVHTTRMSFRNGAQSPLRQVINGSEDEEDRAPAKPLIERWLSPVTNFFLWHWEDESSPKRKVITVSKRHHRLVCLLKTTPIEAMRRKIDLREYPGALDLARKFGLDEDEVYKAQWMRSEVSETTIADYLELISNRRWVLQSCLERVPPSAKAAKLLLRYGLKQTSIITLKDVEDEIEAVLAELSPDEHAQPTPSSSTTSLATRPLSTMDVCLFRMQFLKYLDRLETHETIYAGAFGNSSSTDVTLSETGSFAEHYAWFRDSDLVAQGVDYAITENLLALEQLFTRHGPEVLPFRLSILSHLPDTADPSHYKHLLPIVSVRSGVEAPWPAIPWRKSDWTESQTVKEFVGWVDDDDEDSDPLPPGVERRAYPAPHAVIAEWYASRAREIEALSGQVDLALHLVRLGISNNVTGLDDLHEDLATLSALVYECYAPTSKAAIDVSLEALRAMSEAETLRLMLAESDPSRIVRDIRQFVVPYLDRLARRRERQTDFSDWDDTDAAARDPRTLLYTEILAMAPDRLEWVANILEASRPSAHPSDPIVTSPPTLASLIVESVYTCERTDLLHVQRRLHGCLPVLDAFPPELRARAARLEVHIAAAEILARYSLPRSVAWIRDVEASVDMQKALVVLIARRAVGEGNGVDRFENREDWEALLEHMLELHHSGVVAAVPKREVYREFLAVAIGDGCFELAKHVMQPTRSLPPLPMEVCERIVLDASRDFFDNAESGDITSGYMKMAYDCLKILPITPAIQPELHLIEAVHLLSTRYNVPASPSSPHPILPVQIRVHPDRLLLVRAALQRHAKAYSTPGTILDLSRKLLGDEWTGSSSARVKAMIAEAAVDAGDVAVAVATCSEIVASGVGGEAGDDVWTACVRVGSCAAISDLAARARIVGYALAICPADRVPDVLDLWRRIECEQIAADAAKAGRADAPAGVVGRREGRTGAPVFDLHRAIDDIRRRVLGCEDEEDTSEADVEPGCEFSRHGFYSGEGKGYAIDGGEDISPKRVLLETLWRLEAVRCSGGDGGPGCIDGAGMTNAEIVELAREVYQTDAVLATGYLLSLVEDAEAAPFFASLPASPTLEQLACYYFSLQAIHHLLPLDDPETAPRLAHLPAAEIIRAVSTLHAPIEPLPDADPDVELALSRASLSLASASAHARLMRDKRQERLMAGLNERVDVDRERFEADEAYRKDVVLRLAWTDKDEQMEEAFGVAAQFDVPVEELVLSHVGWLFRSPEVELQTLVARLQLLSETINKFKPQMLATLCEAHPQ